VAQVFVTDEEWAAVLRAVHESLRPGGRLVFESRDPGRRRGWGRTAPTYQRAVIPGVGPVQTWIDLTRSGEPGLLPTTFVFGSDSAVLTSDSMLRFRGRAELENSLTAASLAVDEVRDAPDRPGLEFVFVARKAVTTCQSPGHHAPRGAAESLRTLVKRQHGTRWNACEPHAIMGYQGGWR
jgi:hypothetical protein